jgi:hypothetical protein
MCCMSTLETATRYYFDGNAIRQPQATANQSKFQSGDEPRGRYPKKYGADGGHALRGKNPERLLNSLGGNRRSVWSISTHSYKGAHFATFPPRLVEPCILAGTSARGCCPMCGKPWVRVVESQRIPTRPGTNTKVAGANSRLYQERDPQHDGDYKADRYALEVGNRDPQRHIAVKVTTGWQQSCKCEAHEPIPCTVLDPFGGSGTTAIVAAYHGRS